MDKKRCRMETGDASPQLIPDLQEWVAKRHLDGVVWTNLGAKFAGVERPANVDEVVTYLKGLTGEQSAKAPEYVGRAPPGGRHGLSTQDRRGARLDATGRRAANARLGRCNKLHAFLFDQKTQSGLNGFTLGLIETFAVRIREVDVQMLRKI